MVANSIPNNRIGFVAIEHERKRIVLAQLHDVMAHLVCDPLTWRRRVVRFPGHVQVVLVEEHPSVGSLAGVGPFLRELLDEPGDRRDRLIDLFVESAVQPDLLGQPCGADRGVALVITSDHFGSYGHRDDLLGGRWCVEVESEPARQDEAAGES